MRAPLIIGALGGSGTRIVARIVQRLGYFLGNNRNESEDAMEFVEFYDRWINRYLLRNCAPLNTEEVLLMHDDFISALACHRLGVPEYGSPWGWKEPRSHFLLPFFQTLYPELRFIHVIRDGRDMAFSLNQNQLRKHGAASLPQELLLAPQPVKSAALWTRINGDIASYAEANLPERYMWVRFEDLCAKPAAVAKAIGAFLGSALTTFDEIVAGIEKPKSIGRWREVGDTELLAAVSRHAEPGLRQFGYV